MSSPGRKHLSTGDEKKSKFSSDVIRDDRVNLSTSDVRSDRMFLIFLILVLIVRPLWSSVCIVATAELIFISY